MRYDNYKSALYNAKQNYKDCRPLLQLESAIKYWLNGVEYAGLKPSEEIFHELIKIFMDFQTHNYSYIFTNYRTALYLSSLEFRCERVDSQWWKIYSPLIYKEKKEEF